MTVDCCSAPGLKPFPEALQQILDSVGAVRETEQLPLGECLDRILAEDMLSTTALPEWNCSAMDGYALNSASYQAGQPLKLVGSSFAGHPYDGRVAAAECIRIMTGACVPDDCDVVIMQENVTLEEDQVHIHSDVIPWQNVRKAGSEMSAGVILIQKGERINPRNIGVAATIGLDKLTVYRRLKIALLSTGDELVPPGGKLARGQIFDSNRFSVAAICNRMGYELLDLGLIADDPDVIKSVITKAAATADVLLTSGGVSVGEADYVKDIVEELGRIDLWKVAIKPGKPIAIGSIGDCKFFGLPGNPVSALVTLNLLVQPALQKLSGMNPKPAAMFQAICDTSLRKKPGRRDYQRGIAYTDENAVWHVKSTGAQGSARLTSVADANCYIVLDENAQDISIGEIVNIQFFDEIIC